MPKSKSQPQPKQADVLPAAKKPTKIDILLGLLRSPTGAAIGDMMVATGWQAHSVRGALAGAIKKKLGLVVASEKQDGKRVYRLAPVEAE